jgi:hypothetical protein
LSWTVGQPTGVVQALKPFDEALSVRLAVRQQWHRVYFHDFRDPVTGQSQPQDVLHLLFGQILVIRHVEPNHDLEKNAKWRTLLWFLQP